MRVAALFGLAMAFASAASAGSRIAIPPALQQAAILCLGEALKLCPGALAARDHGVACITSKRRLLSQPCRNVYDQGLSFLKGGDVHLDLRALKAHPPRLRLPQAPRDPGRMPLQTLGMEVSLAPALEFEP